MSRPHGRKARFLALVMMLAAGWLAGAPAGAAEARAGEPSVEEEEFEEEFLLLEEEETVTSAARHEQKISASPSAITVITHQQIAASGALSIPDLLRRVPGIAAVVPSPFFSGISARLPYTFENNQFLVLIDGRQANIELLGQAPWELQPIFMEDIERIEIIRGPGSALYGANAFGGVVSIFTRALPERDSAWVRLEGGEWGRLRASGRGSLRWGDWAAAVSAGYDGAGAFGDPRAPGKEVRKARVLGEWRAGNSARLVLDAGLVDSTGRIPTSVGQVYGGVDLRTVRLAFQERHLQAHLYYVNNVFTGDLTSPLNYAGLHLADFKKAVAATHTVDGELQWSLPGFWEPLLLIAGGRARLGWFDCPNCLDDGFADPASPRYHLPGVEYLEVRGGGYLHAELTPADWLVVTASLRADYNTSTGFFLSPRLAAVLAVSEDHHLRLSAARAFRKPAFMEKGLHVDVTFPPTSPILEGDQTLFREFLTRVIGNRELGNEQLWAFELGYQGRLAGNLDAGVDLYANLYEQFSRVAYRMFTDARGLPDLHRSSFRFEEEDAAAVILGAEFHLGWRPAEWLRLELAYSTFGVWNDGLDRQQDDSPKFLFSLGAEFNHPGGLRGSLFLSGRSPLTEYNIDNPAGLLEPHLTMHLPPALLLQGRLGWRLQLGGAMLETGAKFYLPFSLDPFAWQMHDRAGGVTAAGVGYGGTALLPTVLFYLETEL